MTKAPEQGENEFSDAARRESARTGRNVCDILEQWRRDAKRAKDKKRVAKIVTAPKYLECRNRAKRRKG